MTAFVRVDPDEVRRELPELPRYIKDVTTKDIAGELTRKEAGYICEILTAAALKGGKNASATEDGTL